MNHNQLKASLRKQAQHYWKTARPKGYRELKKAGEWEQHLNYLIDLTLKLYDHLIEQGTPEHMALVQAKEEYLFPPSEAEIAEREDDDSDGLYVRLS
jgi:hypothetical protein